MNDQRNKYIYIAKFKYEMLLIMVPENKIHDKNRYKILYT